MRLFFLILVTVAACSPEPQPDARVPDAPARVHLTGAEDSLLLGRWEGTLYLVAPSERYAAPVARERPLIIELRADTGYFEATLSPMTGREPPDRTARGWRPLRDTLSVQLGTGSDRGEVELRGRLDGDSLVGSWGQIFLPGGARGRFVLRRAATRVSNRGDR